MFLESFLTMLYAGIAGGLIGSSFVYYSMRFNRHQNLKLIEEYWAKDVKEIHLKIDKLSNECMSRHMALVYELSTKSGDKELDNRHKYSTSASPC